MTPQQKLKSLATKLYGPDWRGKLASAMKVHRTSVLRWENGRIPVPESVLLALSCLVKQRKCK